MERKELRSGAGFSAGVLLVSAGSDMNESRNTAPNCWNALWAVS